MSETNLPRPDNNLVWAILTTVLCCLPLGIVSIIKAASVDSLWASGRQEEAVKASKDAKNFAMYGAICGAIIGVFYMIYLVFCFFLGFAGAMA